MAALAYAMTINDATASNTGTTWNGVRNIPNTSLAANTQYVLIMNCLVGGSDNNSNAFEVRTTAESVELAGGYKRFEPHRASAGPDGHKYYLLWDFTTDGTPTDVNFALRLTASGPTGYAPRTQMLAIPVDSTDTDPTALHSGDYAFAKTETLVDITVADQWEDGTSITIGDGTSDWLVFWFGKVGNGSGTNAYHRSRLNVGGTTYNAEEYGRADTQDRLLMGGCMFLSAVASSTTIKPQFASSSTLGDIDANSVFAIRLNAFEDYAGTRNTTPTNVTAADTDTLGGTLTHTTNHVGDVARDWLFFSNLNVTFGENAKRIDFFMDQGGTLLSGDHDGTYTEDALSSANGTAAVNGMLFNTKNLADNIDVDIDGGVQEEADVTPQPVINEANIIGFTTEFAAAGAGTSDVNYSGANRGIARGVARGVA